MDNMVPAIESRANLWADHAIPYATSKIKDFTLDQSGVIFAVFAGYTLYNLLGTQGKTQATDVAPREIMWLKNSNDEVKYMEVPRQGLQLDGSDVENIIEIGYKLLTEKEILVNEKLDEIQTREQLIAWVIKYQELTKGGNGYEPVYGTVGLGLVAVLRHAMVGENVGLLNNEPAIALREGLKELRQKQNLEVLNRTDFAGHKEFQETEIKHLLVYEPGFDVIAKMLTHLGLYPRSSISYALANSPTNIDKAVFGASRLVHNALTVTHIGPYQIRRTNNE